MSDRRPGHDSLAQLAVSNNGQGGLGGGRHSRPKSVAVRNLPQGVAVAVDVHFAMLSRRVP